VGLIANHMALKAKNNFPKRIRRILAMTGAALLILAATVLILFRNELRSLRSLKKWMNMGCIR